MASAVAAPVTRARHGRFRRLWEHSLHRVLYTLLFALVSVGIATLVVPPKRLYSGAHEQIIALTLVMLLVVELASARLHRFGTGCSTGNGRTPPRRRLGWRGR